MLIDGYAYGSWSMTSFTGDGPRRVADATLEGAPALGSDAPPEDTNI